jgi:pimeloyl-ACP methyl ester carboxylesterase
VGYEAHSLRLSREVPGARLRVLPGTGHMVHHTRPRDVIEAIDEVFAMAD